MRKIIIFVIIAAALLVILLRYGFNPKQSSNNQINNTSINQTAIQTVPANNAVPIVYPIADFSNRITKKPFGLYVTPQNSPVEPEHFTGYHTGDDIEYDDIAGDVPVYAMADGEIVLSRTAQGYGGVMVIRHNIKGRSELVLYGHLRPSSMATLNQKVAKGDQIAILGNAFSAETDGERRHLHFGILTNDQIDIRGYVQNQAELSGWYDPKVFLKENIN
jgi:murein DD-endopeptidase MepM/ murein hydrolase activator NlpD